MSRTRLVTWLDTDLEHDAFEQVIGSQEGGRNIGKEVRERIKSSQAHARATFYLPKPAVTGKGHLLGTAICQQPLG